MEARTARPIASECLSQERMRSLSLQRAVASGDSRSPLTPPACAGRESPTLRRNEHRAGAKSASEGSVSRKDAVTWEIAPLAPIRAYIEPFRHAHGST